MGSTYWINEVTTNYINVLSDGFENQWDTSPYTDLTSFDAVTIRGAYEIFNDDRGNHIIIECGNLIPSNIDRISRISFCLVENGSAPASQVSIDVSYWRNNIWNGFVRIYAAGDTYEHSYNLYDEYPAISNSPDFTTSDFYNTNHIRIQVVFSSTNTLFTNFQMDKVRLNCIYVPSTQLYSTVSLDSEYTNRHDGTLKIINNRCSSPTERYYTSKYDVYRAPNYNGAYTYIKIGDYINDYSYTYINTDLMVSNEYRWVIGVYNEDSVSYTGHTSFPYLTTKIARSVIDQAVSMNPSTYINTISWSTTYQSTTSTSVFYKIDKFTAVYGTPVGTFSNIVDNLTCTSNAWSDTSNPLDNNNYAIYRVQSKVGSGGSFKYSYVNAYVIEYRLDTVGVPSGFDIASQYYKYHEVGLDGFDRYVINESIPVEWTNGSSARPINEAMCIWTGVGEEPDPVPGTETTNGTITLTDNAVSYTFNTSTFPDGFYAIRLRYRNNTTASYTYTPTNELGSPMTSVTINKTRGDTWLYTNPIFIRVSTGWQGVICDRLNPSKIAGRHKDTFVKVNDVPDRNLNSDGEEAY